MPGLTGRMSTVVKAKISKMLDKAEDPAETLDYSYEKQLEQLQNVKRGIADLVTLLASPSEGTSLRDAGPGPAAIAAGGSRGVAAEPRVGAIAHLYLRPC